MSLLDWIRGRGKSPHVGAQARIDEARRLVADGQPQAAEAMVREALEVVPEDAAALHLLGSLLAQRGLLDEAAGFLERAVRAAPGRADAQVDLGNVHVMSGRPADGIACYEAALSIRADDFDVLCNLARALTACGRHPDALEAAGRALSVEPDAPVARVLAGNARLALGDALAARDDFTRAIELAPELAEAHAGLGTAHYESGAVDAAIACYRHAVDLQPGFVLALNNLGTALQERGDTDAAREALGRSVALHPAPATRLRLALTVPPIMESRAQIAEVREAYDEALTRLLDDAPRIDDPFRSVGLTSFYLAYHGLDDRPLQRKLASFYERATPSLLATAAHCREPRAPAGRRSVGLVSTYLHDHTIGQTVRGLVAGLDRARFTVTLFCFGRRGDPVETDLHRLADRVVELPMDLAPARERIAAEALDVLFYPDIGMHPMTYYLAFARLAPLQCMSWGHPDTTGIGNLDCFLSTTLAEPPDADAHYTERLVRLPALNFHYRRETPPRPPKSRAALGLAEDANLYLCPQSLFKLHPDFDEIAAGILDGDGEGRLLFLGAPDGADARRLIARMERSLGPLMRRVDFLPPLAHGDFLSLLAACDVALDPLHFSGGRTTSELLAQGTPVVTLPGAFLRGRLTAAFYAAIDLDDFVVADTAQYVATALALGTDASYREESRRRILEAAGGLYENLASVRQLEDVFEGRVA